MYKFYGKTMRLQTSRPFRSCYFSAQKSSSMLKQPGERTPHSKAQFHVSLRQRKKWLDVERQTGKRRLFKTWQTLRIYWIFLVCHPHVQSCQHQGISEEFRAKMTLRAQIQVGQKIFRFSMNGQMNRAVITKTKTLKLSKGNPFQEQSGGYIDQKTLQTFLSW